MSSVAQGQMERGVVCGSGPACQGDLTLETSALGWQKAASPEPSGSLIQECPASWHSGESNC